MSNLRRDKEYLMVEGTGAPEASIFGDENIEGIFRGLDGKLYLDRRLREEVVAQRGLTPRTADLNLIGPVISPLFEHQDQQTQTE